MGERINIARMAEIVAEGMFNKLGWKLHGPPNMSWDCANPAHNKADHPTDATFVYSDPYTGRNVHLLTDLKSYAAGSITTTALKGSIEALALAVDCAKENPNWKELYLKAGADYEVQGLLFIFNHDGEYDRSFPELLTDALEESPKIPQGVRLAVLGPDDIWYLGEMLTDIATLARDGQIPLAPNELSFYYPSQSRSRVALTDRSSVASIDVLKGKYQLLAYFHEGRRGVLVYYRGPGADEREFIVLIDMLRHFGLLDSSDEIMVRCARPSDKASVNFQKALAQYADHSLGTPVKMQKLKYFSVPQVRPRLTEYEVAR